MKSKGDITSNNVTKHLQEHPPFNWSKCHWLRVWPYEVIWSFEMSGMCRANDQKVGYIAATSSKRWQARRDAEPWWAAKHLQKTMVDVVGGSWTLSWENLNKSVFILSYVNTCISLRIIGNMCTIHFHRNSQVLVRFCEPSDTSLPSKCWDWHATS